MHRSNLVVSDVALVPLVFWRYLAGRVANDDGVERYEGFRKSEHLSHCLTAFGRRISTRPHCSQTKGVCGKKNIFACCRDILNPEVLAATLQRLAHVATDNDGKWCFLGKGCVGIGLGKTVKQLAVGDDDKMPRPLIALEG